MGGALNAVHIVARAASRACMPKAAIAAALIERIADALS